VYTRVNLILRDKHGMMVASSDVHVSTRTEASTDVPRGSVYNNSIEVHVTKILLIRKIIN
jgi:hypothetical protein